MTLELLRSAQCLLIDSITTYYKIPITEVNALDNCVINEEKTYETELIKLDKFHGLIFKNSNFLYGSYDFIYSIYEIYERILKDVKNVNK